MDQASFARSTFVRAYACKCLRKKNMCLQSSQLLMLAERCRCLRGTNMNSTLAVNALTTSDQALFVVLLFKEDPNVKTSCLKRMLPGSSSLGASVGREWSQLKLSRCSLGALLRSRGAKVVTKKHEQGMSVPGMFSLQSKS